MKKALFFVCVGILQFCQRPASIEAEKKAILDLHNRQRRAHFEKNVSMLLENDTEDLVQINRGLTSSASKKEKTERFQTYFDAVEFVKWDDAEPPVFSFSDDATMATTIVKKMVVLKLKQENNRLDTTHFAWLAVYKKTKGRWGLHRMASTKK